MKIYHTGDWHIGKVFLHKSFIDEQREVIGKFLEKVESDMPDLVIIAGDIYDKSIPTVEAVGLLNETLSKLVMEHKRKVVIISGNHDSADRLSFGSEMLEDKGLHIVTDVVKSISPIELEDEHGKVNVYAVPYISPMKARAVFPGEEIKDHDDVARVVIGKICEKLDKSERNICIYHGFVTNSGERLQESESERPLSIGGSDEVSAEYFKDFDYVALGHLHGPQKVKTERIRYSGSLMKYSFSEQNHRKGITSVCLGEKQGGSAEMSCNIEEIYPSRDMRIIEGSLEELLAENLSEAESEDYIMARIVADGELYSPKDKLDKVYKNILRIEIKRDATRLEGEKAEFSRANFREKSVLELFRDFYAEVTDMELEGSKEEKLASLLENMDMEEF